MSTNSATQLDQAEKKTLVRYKCGFYKRTGQSQCLARSDFVNSCCKGCEPAELKKCLDQNTEKQEEFNASIQDFGVTCESTLNGTPLRKASGKLRMPQRVQV